MALTTDLLKLLDNGEEPLTKRLRIADNAFKSQELPIQHRECFLLNWISKLAKSKDVDRNDDIWNQCYAWLASEQFKELNRSDINLSDCRFITEMVINGLVENNDLTTKSVVLSIAETLIVNRVFQQHFKYDIKNYCGFIASILENVNDEHLLLKFIKNEQIFNKFLIVEENFASHFLNDVLPTLSSVALKFKFNQLIFEELSKLVQKCLFFKNHKLFEAYFKSCFDNQPNDSTLPNILIKFLKNSVNSEGFYNFKLVFNAFTTSYSNDFSIIYNFFVIILNLLGFDLSNCFKLSVGKLKKKIKFASSMNILVGVLEILTKTKLDLNCKINEITFSVLIQNFVQGVLKYSQNLECSYKILKLIILINPLIIETLITQIVSYTMLSNNDDCKIVYETLLISIFEVFEKLHRIQNLISKMVKSLKESLEGAGASARIEEGFSFLGEIENAEQNEGHEFDVDVILPQNLLDFYSRCIMGLASWQVMNLYKTLLFHLGDAIDTDLQSIVNDNKKILYIEIICTLTSTFLSSVRIAEHTVSTQVVDKFVKSMEQHKELLSKFGNVLVKMEHNHNLMKTYLVMCYTWGELNIPLNYYSTSGSQFEKLESDSSACNLTYLHPYLTKDQWCNISERITNFGEKSCRIIMQKLCVQKIRAMLIFESEISEDLYTSLIHNVSIHLDDHYECLIKDQFSLNTVVTRLDNASLTNISSHIIKDIIDLNNYDILNKTSECQILSNAILYGTLSKINRHMKVKRKTNDDHPKEIISVKMFNLIPEEIICSDLDDSIAGLSKILTKQLEKLDGNDTKIKVNEEKLIQLLELFSKLPIVYSSHSIQSILFLYISGLLIDLKATRNEMIINKLETLLIGIVQQGSIFPPNLLKTSLLFKFLTNHLTSYEGIFQLIIDTSFKSQENIIKLKPGVSYIVKNFTNQKNVRCANKILLSIYEHKKNKLSGEAKEMLNQYKMDICEVVVNHLENKSKESFEIFAQVLKMYLAMGDTENVKKLQKYVQEYIDLGFSDDSTGWLLLQLTILQHKTEFEEIVKNNFILNTWECIKDKKVLDKDYKILGKLMVAIFEHVPDDQFNTIINDLLDITMGVITSKNDELFKEKLKLWNSVLGCSFNPNKMKFWQEALEKLFIEICYNSEYCKSDEFLKFEINLIHSVHILLTPAILDSFFVTVPKVLSGANDFNKKYSTSVSKMDGLLKFRKPLITDRLPSYLQTYRCLVKHVCLKGNSNLDSSTDIQQVADWAHQLEKLTKNLVSLNKHMASVTIYVIADVLQAYETITLYPAVKMHLNNCLYSLISLCDQHAISCLMRVLSTASTEIFKLLFETYKKYYQFTGKV